MKSTTLASLAFVAIAQMLSGALAQNPTETGGSTPRPSHPAVFNQVVSQGCYKTQGNLTDFDVIDENTGNKVQASLGGCRDVCIPKKYLVLALHGDKCYCGDTYPELDELAKDAECNKPCYYGGFEPCGNWKTQGKGVDRWSVYNTGIETDVDNYVPDKAETTSSAPAASKTSSGSDPGKTGEAPEDSARPTNSSNAGDDDGGEEKKGTNVAGIAAGVVVGVVAIAALIGGGFFYMRRKRNAEIEEEHRRNAAVNAFISGAKPPGSSGNVSMSDSRLEPGLAHRRLSDGSIADNQDYSRKILRVTNA